jgi:hypothetical protein
MNQRHVTNLYSDIFESSGGYLQSGGKPPSTQVDTSQSRKKVDTTDEYYIPSDDSHKHQKDVSALFKVNRMLQKELQTTKKELLKTQQQLHKIKMQLDKVNRR